MSNELKLEAGKFYRTREGYKARISKVFGYTYIAPSFAATVKDKARRPIRLKSRRTLEPTSGRVR